MIPLFVLVTVFALSALAIRLSTGRHKLLQSARIGMCAMLFFTASGHFAFTKGMAMMVPSVVPFKTEAVYLTGVLEILLGIGLLVPSARRYAGWALLVFLLMMLPANVNAALNHIDYQKATLDGNGPSYLWFRVPLQILFMAWTYLSAIKKWPNA